MRSTHTSKIVHIVGHALSILIATLIIILPLRLLVSNWFIKFEYFYRPNFPQDQFGFNATERLLYGSYIVDYLNNNADKIYLENVRFSNTEIPFLLDTEISHMKDVKQLLDTIFILGFYATIISTFIIIALHKNHSTTIKKAIKNTANYLIYLTIILATLIAFFWNLFFEGLHKIFFPTGTWTFYSDDTLIRLFPETFWIDAGIFITITITIIAIATKKFYKPKKISK